MRKKKSSVMDYRDPYSLCYVMLCYDYSTFEIEGWGILDLELSHFLLSMLMTSIFSV